MESDLGKLFIGGISWDTNEERLKEYFRNYGEVVEAVIMKDRTTGRARGFGFVMFTDPAVAERVAMERHMIDGRMVEAKKAVPREDQILNRNSISVPGLPSPARTKKIFVGGLASTVTENDLKRYFDQFGTITDAVVMYDHNTQRPRGFGFITYDSEDAVDKVLFKTFHELHGKMVEVKRAVPKELSPGPNRSPLSGYNYGLSRINSFLDGYPLGYNPSTISGFGVRMDPRFSPIVGSRNAIPPFGPGYEMSGNYNPELRSSYGGNPSFNSTIGYSRGLNPYYNGNASRFGNASAVGYGLGNVGSSSILSSPSRNVWGNEGLNYAMNSPSSNFYKGIQTGNLGGSTFDNSRTSWNMFPISSQAGASASRSASSNSLGYTGDDIGYGLGGGGYGRSRGGGVASTTSYSAPSDHLDGTYGNSFGGSVYGDPTWLSTTSEMDESGSFGYGLRRAPSDVTS
ncbi:hypothetical protein Syun_009690 [Stephania yunnanensis]|uniref:RRM domain-containing protein n=1 Tax=Stephania yunnanensis TaxID=152371 RepID=A0AAP0KEZ8_9MAGN